MKTNTKLTKLSLVLLLTFTLISGCAKPEPVVQESIELDPVKQELLNDINSLAEINDFEGLSVSVYQAHPETRYRAKLTLDQLIEWPDKTFKLEGDDIKGKLNLFGQIQAEDIRLESLQRGDVARFYLVIESVEKGKLFDILLFGYRGDIFIVNGVHIMANQKFLDMIMPLLNYDAKYNLRAYGEWF